MRRPLVIAIAVLLAVAVLALPATASAPTLQHRVAHLKHKVHRMHRQIASLRYQHWGFVYQTNCELSKIELQLGNGPQEDVDYWCNGDSIYSVPTPDPPPGG